MESLIIHASLRKTCRNRYSFCCDCLICATNFVASNFSFTDLSKVSLMISLQKLQSKTSKMFIRQLECLLKRHWGTFWEQELYLGFYLNENKYQVKFYRFSTSQQIHGVSLLKGIGIWDVQAIWSVRILRLRISSIKSWSKRCSATIQSSKSYGCWGRS